MYDRARKIDYTTAGIMDIYSFPPELYELFLYTPFEFRRFRCTCKQFSEMADPFQYSYEDSGFMVKNIRGRYINLRITIRLIVRGVISGTEWFKVRPDWYGDRTAILVRSGDPLEYLTGSVSLYRQYRRLVHSYRRTILTRVVGDPWPQHLRDKFALALHTQNAGTVKFTHAGVEVRVRIRSILVRYAGKLTTYSRTQTRNPVVFTGEHVDILCSGCPKALPLIAGLAPIYAPAQ